MKLLLALLMTTGALVWVSFLGCVGIVIHHVARDFRKLRATRATDGRWDSSEPIEPRDVRAAELAELERMWDQ